MDNNISGDYNTAEEEIEIVKEYLNNMNVQYEEEPKKFTCNGPIGTLKR